MISLLGTSRIWSTRKQEPKFNVQSGQSHIALFNAVLPAMFDDVVVIDSLDDAVAAEVDAVFTPLIEEFQLALPMKTKLDVYEVWIKYNMRLATAEGDYMLTGF